MVELDSPRITRVLSYLRNPPRKFEFYIQGYHLLWLQFPLDSIILPLSLLWPRNPPPPKSYDLSLWRSLDCSHFARRYLGNHYCFLFLRLLRCFSSARAPLEIMYSSQITHAQLNYQKIQSVRVSEYQIIDRSDISDLSVV